MNSPKLELLLIIFNLLRWMQKQVFRVEKWNLEQRLRIIEKIRGEQSTYGW